MAEATQEKQEIQSQQLVDVKDKLTAIVQQLQIANAEEGSTKDEFRKANQSVLQAILESNQLKKVADAGLDDEETKDKSRWGKLLGHFSWAKKFQERSAKLAKVAAGSVVKFGKTKLAKVTRFAGNMLDLLLKGLGLGVLWALFKWLEGKDWDEIVSKVKSWVEAIGLDWDATVATLESIKTTLVEWGGLVGGIWTTVKAWKAIAWIANFGGSSLALMWAALKGIFGLGGLIAGILKTVLVWSGTLMFGEEGLLTKLWKGVKSIFGPGSKIGTLVGTVKNWAAAGLFGETGVLTKLWTNIKGFFGIGGKLSQTPGFLRTAEQMVDAKGLGLGKEGPLIKLWNWIKSFFGAESKLAGAWKAIKESKAVTTLFGEGSHLRNLWTWIGSFFGPESNLGKAATWIGGKVKLFKDYLLIGDKAGKGGAISRLFSWVGGIFSGIGDGWKSMQKAKWFTGLKTALGGVGKFVAAIMVPLRWILLPLTWILGIGAAVMGFVQGFMGKEGVKDERTLGTKIMDGLRGAMKGLLDFFVVDLVVMVEDVLNYFVDMWNESALGSWKKFDKFTFGSDLQKTTTEMMGFSEASSLSGDGKPLDIDKVLETAGGEKKRKGRSGSTYEIGIDKFGDVIDKLDMVGLQKMSEKMEAMDKDKKIDLKNAEGINKRLQAEIKERLAENAKLKNQIPTLAPAATPLPGAGGVTQAVVSQSSGTNNYLGGSPGTVDRNIIKSEGDSTRKV